MEHSNITRGIRKLYVCTCSVCGQTETTEDSYGRVPEGWQFHQTARRRRANETPDSGDGFSHNEYLLCPSCSDKVNEVLLPGM